MTVEVALLVSIVSVCFSAFFGLKSNRRADTSEIEQRIAENTKLNMKLDEIARSVNELKDEMRLQKAAVQELAERMARVEASAKQAHHRMDRLEGKECRHDE